METQSLYYAEMKTIIDCDKLKKERERKERERKGKCVKTFS